MTLPAHRMYKKIKQQKSWRKRCTENKNCRFGAKTKECPANCLINGKYNLKVK